MKRTSPLRGIPVTEEMQVCLLRFGSWAPTVIHPVIFQSNGVTFSFDAAKDHVARLRPRRNSTSTGTLIRLEPKDITLCQYSLKKGMPTIFLYTTPKFAMIVRDKLKMTKRTGPYFDPGSSVESEKRIVMRPVSDPDHIQARKVKEAFDGMARCTKRLASAVFEELNKDALNRLLVISSPVLGDSSRQELLPPTARQPSTPACNPTPANAKCKQEETIVTLDATTMRITGVEKVSVAMEDEAMDDGDVAAKGDAGPSTPVSSPAPSPTIAKQDKTQEPKTKKITQAKGPSTGVSPNATEDKPMEDGGDVTVGGNLEPCITNSSMKRKQGTPPQPPPGGDSDVDKDLNHVKEMLAKYRLERFYDGLVDLGVTRFEDLNDLMLDDLRGLGFRKIQINRFCDMASKEGLHLSWNADSMSTSSYSPPPAPMESQSSAESKADTSCGSEVAPTEVSMFEIKTTKHEYTLKYKTQNQKVNGSPPQVITSLDPQAITLREVADIIVGKEGLSEDQSVELYTAEGIPLTNGTYLDDIPISKRCVESGSTIFGIICKKNINDAGSYCGCPTSEKVDETNTITCCLLTGERFKIPVTLNKDTIADVKTKLTGLTGIPESVQSIRLANNGSFILNESTSLEDNGIQIGETLHVFFNLPASPLDSQQREDNFTCKVQPYVQQTEKGMSFFAATLYIMSGTILPRFSCGSIGRQLLGLIRRLTCLPPLVAALDALGRTQDLTYSQKVAIVEGLYILFRRILPKSGGLGDEQLDVSDECVFEHADKCWIYLLSLARRTDMTSENFKVVNLVCVSSGHRLIHPVQVSSIPGKIFSRSLVLSHIAETKELEGKLPSDEDTTPELDMQRLILCHPMSNECHVWDPPEGSIKDRPDDIEVLNATDVSYLPSRGLNLIHPLRLFERENAITVNDKHEYVVLTGMSKCPGVPLRLYNPKSMETEEWNAHELADKVGDFKFKEDISDRKPDEVIVVLFDTSWSMTETCFDSEMTKLDAAKELFYAFADRSMAYNFRHFIGLTTFSSTVEVVGGCDRLYERFKKSVESVEIGASTKLYDALAKAVEQLDQLGQSFPECKRRIICLTDGFDVSSSFTAVQVTQKMLGSKIVLDAVQLLHERDRMVSRQSVLKAIAFATGGCCFKPTSLAEGRKIFEMETVLSIRARKVDSPSPVNISEIALCFLQHRPWTTKPTHTTPVALEKPAARTHAVLVKASQLAPNTVMTKNKRLLKEMAAFQREPHPAFSIYPSESSFDFWKILMVGPTDTPYEGGVFSLYVDFPDQYPQVPPTIRFLTPIYHCNINSIGRICHGIFDRNYRSDLNIKTIFSCVYGLLMTPEPKDPLDGVLAEEYFTSKVAYNQKAKEWTQLHAGTSLEKCEKEILESSTLPKRPMPSHLVCPLTKQMFVDPVQTPYGHVYERHAIECALNTLPMDPQEQLPLEKSELNPATTVRRQVADFRESLAKVAACWLK